MCWEEFCPDISMPPAIMQLPSPRHHTRRHSGLCPDGFRTQERDAGHSTPPTQISIKDRRPYQQHDRPEGFHHKCHCETVTPIDNLSERYGLVEEEPSGLTLRQKQMAAGMQHKNQPTNRHTGYDKL